MKRLKKLACLLGAVFLLTTGTSQAKTLLFVPQDNRPVSFAYTVETAEDAGYTVLCPPAYLLSGNMYTGSPDRLWEWVKENAPKSDAMILSSDSLIYGGLVDSRKHNFSLPTLMRRVDEFARLKQAYPQTPIYGFGTVMRSPYASNGTVEPSYYDEYGTAIWQMAALMDKQDTEGLTGDEGRQLFALFSSIPIEYLQDWFDRRNKNMQVNMALIEDAANGVFTYFSLGHDDTSSHSQSSMEGRYLSKLSATIPTSVYGSFPGADQLGLLLIARAHNDFNGLKPKVAVLYPLGGADKTIPHYEDQTVGVTLEQHVIAAGGTMAKRDVPDLLLAVNTPLGKVTGESSAFENFPMLMEYERVFLGQIETVMQKGIPVSVADVAYSNGSDNTLVYGLMQKGILYDLAAYNGWNTASNTIGYAIAQGMLASTMTKKAHDHMLTTQLLDNWAYQANIRKEIQRLKNNFTDGNKKYYGTLDEELESQMRLQIQRYAEKYLHVDPRTIEASFPWNRLFEVQIKVHDEPVVPLEKEVRAQKEKEELERQKQLAQEKAKQENAAKNGQPNGVKGQ